MYRISCNRRIRYFAIYHIIVRKIGLFLNFILPDTRSIFMLKVVIRMIATVVEKELCYEIWIITMKLSDWFIKITLKYSLLICVYGVGGFRKNVCIYISTSVWLLGDRSIFFFSTKIFYSKQTRNKRIQYFFMFMYGCRWSKVGGNHYQNHITRCIFPEQTKILKKINF